MEGSEPAPNLLIGLLLSDIHRELVANGKMTILHAEAILVLSMEGLKAGEIQKRIGITDEEYRRARGRLLEAIKRAGLASEDEHEDEVPG